MPSWPMRLSAGISMLSKKSALVEWFIIMRSGRTSSPLQAADVDEEDAEPVRPPLHLVHRGGARQQQHQVGLEHAGDEHLLAVDHVAVALAHGRGLELGRVGAGVGLGDAEGLEAQLAAWRSSGRYWLLLRLGAVPQHRAHDVHLRVAGARRCRPSALIFSRISAPSMMPRPAPPYSCGISAAEVAGLGQLVDEGLRDTRAWRPGRASTRPGTACRARRRRP